VDTSHVIYVHESDHICGWVILHMWLSHTKHVDESCYIVLLVGTVGRYAGQATNMYTVFSTMYTVCGRNPNLVTWYPKNWPRLERTLLFFLSFFVVGTKTYVYCFLYQQVPWYMGVLRSGPVSWVTSNNGWVFYHKERKEDLYEWVMSSMNAPCRIYKISHVWISHVTYIK